MIEAMRYPGGKFRCYQKLINLIPTHRVYIETHLGGGAVMRHKSPAEENIGVDLDSAVIRAFKGFGNRYQFHVLSAEEFLGNYRFEGDEFCLCRSALLARKPRRSRRPLYRHTYYWSVSTNAYWDSKGFAVRGNDFRLRQSDVFGCFARMEEACVCRDIAQRPTRGIRVDEL